MTFDPTKPVQTRNGKKARILATNRISNEFPIVALVTESPDREAVRVFSSEGRYVDKFDSGLDLVNIPERTELFVNVYNKGQGRAHIGAVYRLLEAARAASIYPDYDHKGTIRLVYEDDKLISVGLVSDA